MKKDRSAYLAKHLKENYDLITIKVYKGDREFLREFAEKHSPDGSVVGMFVEAMKAQYGVDLRRKRNDNKTEGEQ